MKLAMRLIPAVRLPCLLLAGLLASGLPLGLGGCAAEDSRERGGEADSVHDPVMTAAIEGQLMVDPDLSQSNMRNMAVVPAGAADPALPLSDPEGH